MSKLCPILSLDSRTYFNKECLGKDCVWYDMCNNYVPKLLELLIEEKEKQRVRQEVDKVEKVPLDSNGRPTWSLTDGTGRAIEGWKNIR